MAVKKSKIAAKKTKAPAKKSKAAAKKAKAPVKKPKAAPKPKKAVIKTTETSASVEKFLSGVKNEQQRKDSFAIVEMMKKATGAEPKMWGSSIIGFGNKVYTSPATGRSVDWFLIGFAPRKANISLYLVTDLKKRAEGLEKLGKYKTDGGCIYINKLTDVDVKVLKGMFEAAAKGK